MMFGSRDGLFSYVDGRGLADCGAFGMGIMGYHGSGLRHDAFVMALCICTAWANGSARRML